MVNKEPCRYITFMPIPSMRLLLGYTSLIISLAGVLTSAAPLAATAVQATPPANAQPVTIYFSWGDGCPHCAKAEPFLAGLAQEYPTVEVRAYEVWYTTENQGLFQPMAAAYGFEPSGVPTILIYQIDELGLFLVAVFTLKASRLGESEGRILKLVGGLLMLTLALVMLVNPAWMNQISSSLLVFAVAFGATALVLLVHRKVLSHFGIHIGSELVPTVATPRHHKHRHR